MNTLWIALMLGGAIGAQHALEPDHLAAIGTMAPDGSNPRQAAMRGAWWGIGHGGVIALVGGVLIAAGLRVPEALESAGELMVAIMLVALGGRALWLASRARPTAHTEAAAPHQSLPIGLVHGLAGSGAAIVLATAHASSSAVALGFLASFAIGSTLSMAAIASLLSVPIRRLAVTPARLNALLMVAGAVSIAIGVVWGTGAVSAL